MRHDSSRVSNPADVRRLPSNGRAFQALMLNDDATVLHACRLLHEALCDDLELRQLTVDVKRDRVSLTIHSKRGRQESKAKWSLARPRMSVRWRTLARNGRNLKPSPHIKTASCFGKLR